MYRVALFLLAALFCSSPTLAATEVKIAQGSLSGGTEDGSA